MTNPANRLLIRSTYRHLAKAAKHIDGDVCLRCLVSGAPRDIYDHRTQAWVAHEPPAAEWGSAAKAFDQVITAANSNRMFYCPGQGEPLLSVLRRSYKTTPFSVSQLNVAFTSVKYVNRVLELAKAVQPPPIETVTTSSPPAAGSPPESSPPVIKWNVASDYTAPTTPPPEGRPEGALPKPTLLVAHPLLPSFFKHAIILLVKSDPNWTAGLVINKPLMNAEGLPVPVWAAVPDTYHELFSKHLSSNPVLLAGPVASSLAAQQAIYVMHRVPGITGANEVFPGVYLSGDLDQLAAKCASGEADPSMIMVLVGYSGWGRDQLEGEVKQGSWFVLTQDESAQSSPVVGRAAQCADLASLVFHVGGRPTSAEPQSAATEDADLVAASNAPQKLWQHVLHTLGGPYAQMPRLAGIHAATEGGGGSDGGDASEGNP